MKRITAVLLVLAFAGVILLPVNVTVNNHSSEKPSIADNGGPVTASPPCVFDASSSGSQSRLRRTGWRAFAECAPIVVAVKQYFIYHLSSDFCGAE